MPLKTKNRKHRYQTLRLKNKVALINQNCCKNEIKKDMSKKVFQLGFR